MPYPPLGTLYAATILKNLGHEVIFYDCMLSDDPENFNEKIISEKPDLTLIYDDEFNYLTKMCLSNMRKAALSFIRTSRSLNIPVIIYSSDATDFYTPYLEAGCDGIIYGEGETTLQEVVAAFGTGSYYRERKSIEGLKFLENNEPVVTPQRKTIKDIDELPLPDYSFVKIDEYRKIWLQNHNYFSLNISTTRGCPYKCNWCAKPIYGKIYNSRTPGNVIKQIRELKNKYSIDHLWITDDIFGLKPGWIREFAAGLQKLNLNIPYKCLSRPDLLLRDDTLLHLKNSGCRTIWIGAESGSQKILDAMEKGTTVEQIYDAAEKAHKYGIEIAFFIQFGYSGETWEDIKLTRKMINECKPEDIGISVSYPLPGTKFYENVKLQMKNKTNWIDSDDLDMMFSGSYPKPFYKLLHRFVHAEYRLKQFSSVKNVKDILYIVYYFIRFVVFRIKLNKYLRQGEIRAAEGGEAYQSI